jgi:phenylalanyl-tRNA synthetase beta subunit
LEPRGTRLTQPLLVSQAAIDTILAHAALERRTALVTSLLGQVESLPQRVNVSDFTPYPREFPATLKKLEKLAGRDYGKLAVMAANIREERQVPLSPSHSPSHVC